MIFSKRKEDKPKTAYRISILTNEYLMDGFNNPDYPALSAAFDTEMDSPLSGSLDLKEARIQSMGDMTTPSHTFDLWRMPSLLNVIAMFSDDPAAEDDLLNIWEEYQTPFKAVIYAGAYIIEGTIYSDDEDPPAFGIRLFAPMEDVKITYQLGKKSDVIRAKWGVVNSAIMQGYSIEK